MQDYPLQSHAYRRYALAQRADPLQQNQTAPRDEQEEKRPNTELSDKLGAWYDQQTNSGPQYESASGHTAQRHDQKLEQQTAQGPQHYAPYTPTARQLWLVSSDGQQKNAHITPLQQAGEFPQEARMSQLHDNNKKNQTKEDIGTLLERIEQARRLAA